MRRRQVGGNRSERRGDEIGSGPTLNAIPPLATAATPDTLAPNPFDSRYWDLYERRDAEWTMRLTRLGALILVVTQPIFLASEVFVAREPLSRILAFHVFNLVICALTLWLTTTRWILAHWRGMALAVCTMLIASSTYNSIGTPGGRTEALFMTVFTMLLGAALFVPWSWRWQSMLGAIGFAAYGFDRALSPASAPDPFAVYHWIGLATAALLAEAAATFMTRYRMQTVETEALTASEHRLRKEIAERERMRRILQENEDKFRKSFDSSLDAIAFIQLPEGRFLDVNAEFERRTGLRREQVVGKTYREVPAWLSDDEVQRFMAELETQGFVRAMEVTLREAGGVSTDRLLSGALVELGESRCVIITSHDVSKLKRTERELAGAHDAALAASRAKTEFLSSMSHEIRTPMNAILGMSDLLYETELTPEQRRYLDIVRSNSATLLGLINDILDLARIEGGRFKVEKTHLQIDELVEQVASGLALRAHQKGLEFAVRIAPEVPVNLLGDPLRLRQVLVNLLGNAIKFTAKGEVVLTVELAGPAGRPANAAGGDGEPTVTLHFTVTDTGIGIPRDKLESVFERFAQADSSTSRKFGGTGLGLAIVKGLTELLGGQVWVESVPGQGSAFHFTAVLGIESPGTGPSVPARDIAGARILVADDTAVNRLVVSETLTRLGAEVDEAASGAETLDRIAQAQAVGRPYGLILLDSRMPGMDGFEVARRIRAGNESGSDGVVTVLLLTSDDLGAKGAMARQAGAYSYLVKPIKRAELAVTAGAALGRAAIQPTPARVETPSAAPAPHPQTLRILLADDSPDNRALVHAYLKTTAWEIDDVEDGAEAVKKFTSEGPYDLVLMDIRMPVLDGYGATRAIRRWEREHGRVSTPIIALTASVFAEAVRKTREAGCTLHVAKPIKRQALLDVIGCVLGGAHEKMPSETPAAARLPN